MAMDLGRTATRGMMQTIHGEPPIEVVWFDAPPGAKVFKGRTVFRGRDWEKDHTWDGIGYWEEPLSPWGKRVRDYYKGGPPAPYTGQDYCGTAEAAEGGAVIGRDALFAVNAVGMAPCCATPFYVAAGGEREGGAAVLIVAPFAAATGGEREGGAAVLVPPPSYVGAGGEAEGGFADILPILQAAGGEAEGGFADILPILQAAGGEAEGGFAALATIPSETAAGGEREGGAAVLAPVNWLTGWAHRKPIRYSVVRPLTDQVNYPKQIIIPGDPQIAAALSAGGGVNFTEADGTTAVPFGLFGPTNLSIGTVYARVRFALLDHTKAAGDVMGYIYYDPSQTSPQNKPATVSNGYTVFLDCEQSPAASAPQLLDWVTDSNVGTVQGGMGAGNSITAVIGKGLSFDGTDDYVRIDRDTARPASDFTIELMFRCSGVQVSRWAVAFGRVGNVNQHCGIRMSATSGGRVNAEWRNNANLTASLTYTTALNDGAWHCAAFTRSGNAFELFTDGTSRATGTQSGAITTDTLSLGAKRGPTAASFWLGDIDEVRVSSSARSADWLKWAATDDQNATGTYTLGPQEP